MSACLATGEATLATLMTGWVAGLFSSGDGMLIEHYENLTGKLRTKFLGQNSI